jgi:hypothetical protein
MMTRDLISLVVNGEIRKPAEAYLNRSMRKKARRANGTTKKKKAKKKQQTRPEWLWGARREADRRNLAAAKLSAATHNEAPIS